MPVISILYMYCIVRAYRADACVLKNTLLARFLTPPAKKHHSRRLCGFIQVPSLLTVCIDRYCSCARRLQPVHYIQCLLVWAVLSCRLFSWLLPSITSHSPLSTSGSSHTGLMCTLAFPGYNCHHRSTRQQVCHCALKSGTKHFSCLFCLPHLCRLHTPNAFLY